MSIRITCIKKANGLHENPYVAISYLGWVEAGTNKTGSTSREEMYHWIRDKNGIAYVQAGEFRAQVVTAVSPKGTRYVKTVADSTARDNLLKLPECK
ncbi:MAG: DUF3892 domain-containing protein [Gemmatimonadaceae bacterium]